MRTVEETAGAFARACAAAKVDYAIVGAFAVGAWGAPRATRDVDVLMRVPSPVEPFAVALRAEGLSVVAQDLVDAEREGGHATILDDSSLLHIDVKAARSQSELRQIEHAVIVEASGAPFRIAAPEDTIAYKLVWDRPIDRSDVDSIVERWGSRLDRKRLVALGVELGVERRMKRVIERLPGAA